MSEANVDGREKVEEFMSCEGRALVVTLFGYVSAVVGIAGGFWFFYKLMSNSF